MAIDIDSLTFGEIKSLKSLVQCGTDHSSKTLPLVVGKNYFLQTATLYFVGKVKEVTPTYVCLSDAAWVADCGRFTQFLADGNYSEAEPCVDDVYVMTGGMITAMPWRHDLIRKQK